MFLPDMSKILKANSGLRIFREDASTTKMAPRQRLKTTPEIEAGEASGSQVVPESEQISNPQPNPQNQSGAEQPPNPAPQPAVNENAINQNVSDERFERHMQSLDRIFIASIKYGQIFGVFIVLTVFLVMFLFILYVLFYGVVFNLFGHIISKSEDILFSPAQSSKVMSSISQIYKLTLPSSGITEPTIIVPIDSGGDPR